MAQKKIDGLPTIEDIQQEITEEQQAQAESQALKQKKDKLKPVFDPLGGDCSGFAGLFSLRESGFSFPRR